MLESPFGRRASSHIQEKKLSVRDKIAIGTTGETVATIKKALVSPARPLLDRGRGWQGHRGQGQHRRPRVRVQAGRRQSGREVSKRWFRVRDTYGVEVAPGQDDALILALHGVPSTRCRTVDRPPRRRSEHHRARDCTSPSARLQTSPSRTRPGNKDPRSRQLRLAWPRPAAAQAGSNTRVPRCPATVSH